MSSKTVTWLFILLVLAALWKRWPHVTSRIIGPPTWEGQLGDVVNWGGKTWAWTPGYGWVEIAEDGS